MVAGVLLVHGTIALFLVVGQNIVGIAYVIVLHHNMVEMIVRLTDPQILRLKCVMRIHAPVSSKFLMNYYQMFLKLLFQFETNSTKQCHLFNCS